MSASARCSALAGRALELWQMTGSTPVVRLDVTLPGPAARTLYLKLESANPTGSSKARPAARMLFELARAGVLKPQSKIVESTSGNLGVALAWVCAELGLEFTAVVDPLAATTNVAHIKRLGGRVELVTTRDDQGGFLLSRLRRVRALCDADNRYVWPNQYQNDANRIAHALGTGAEIAAMDPRPDVVLVPISTGGTFAGIRTALNATRTTVIAVDVPGSIASGHGQPNHRLRRVLTGIGASRPSGFASPLSTADVRIVSPQGAIAACHRLGEEGHSIGGSSGAAVAAALSELRREPEYTSALVLCPDGADRYADTIFSSGWLHENGLSTLDQVPDVPPLRQVGAPLIGT